MRRRREPEETGPRADIMSDYFRALFIIHSAAVVRKETRQGRQRGWHELCYCCDVVWLLVGSELLFASPGEIGFKKGKGTVAICAKLKMTDGVVQVGREIDLESFWLLQMRIVAIICWAKHFNANMANSSVGRNLFLCIFSMISAFPMDRNMKAGVEQRSPWCAQ